MKFIFTFLFLLPLQFNFFVPVEGRDEYLPVLMWSSSQFQDGPVLALNKIKSDLFETFLIKKMSNKKPLIVVFLEQILSADDFDWRDENGTTSYSFLRSIPDRVDYFPYVETPHNVLVKLSERGYEWRHMHPKVIIKKDECVLLLTEFRNINKDRPEVLRSHDEAIAEASKMVGTLRDDWICIYTARHTKIGDQLPKKNSPWHVPLEEQKQTRTLYTYRDDYSRMALLTRGPIQLHLPSHRNHTIKVLEDYLGASAVRNGETLDFVIWFQNYTLTFYMSMTDDVWTIDNVKIQNDDGHSLKLLPKSEDDNLSNKCYRHATEFWSIGKPLIKVKLSKYLITHISKEESVCASFYSIPFLCLMLFGYVVIIFMMWNTCMHSSFSRTEEKKAPTKFTMPLKNLLQTCNHPTAVP